MAGWYGLGGRWEGGLRVGTWMGIWMRNGLGWTGDGNGDGEGRRGGGGEGTGWERDGKGRDGEGMKEADFGVGGVGWSVGTKRCVGR